MVIAEIIRELNIEIDELLVVDYMLFDELFNQIYQKTEILIIRVFDGFFRAKYLNDLGEILLDFIDISEDLLGYRRFNQRDFSEYEHADNYDLVTKFKSLLNKILLNIEMTAKIEEIK